MPTRGQDGFDAAWLLVSVEKVRQPTHAARGAGREGFLDNPGTMNPPPLIDLLDKGRRGIEELLLRARAAAPGTEGRRVSVRAAVNLLAGYLAMMDEVLLPTLQYHGHGDASLLQEALENLRSTMAEAIVQAERAGADDELWSRTTLMLAATGVFEREAAQSLARELTREQRDELAVRADALFSAQSGGS